MKTTFRTLLAIFAFASLAGQASAIEENTIINAGVLRAVVGPKGSEYRSPIYIQSYNSGRWITRLVRYLPLGRISSIKAVAISGGSSTSAALQLQRTHGSGRHATDYFELYATTDSGVNMLSGDFMHSKQEFNLDRIRLFNQNGSLYASVAQSNYSCSIDWSPMCQYKRPPNAAVTTHIKKLHKSLTQAELNARLANGWDYLPESATLVSFPHTKINSISSSSIGNKLNGQYCTYLNETQVSCSSSVSFFVELP